MATRAGSTGTAKTSTSKSTRKTSAKKQPAQKSAQKKSAQQSAQKKSTANDASGPSSRRSAPRAESRPSMSAGEVARTAAEQLAELIGQQVESVTGLERTEDGWKVEAEVLELRRIPSTTDVLATYEILVDSRGDLEGYRRAGRYARGDTRSDQ